MGLLTTVTFRYLADLQSQERRKYEIDYSYHTEKMSKDEDHTEIN